MGKAFTLDGVNDAVTVSDNNWLDITGDITLSAWVWSAANRADGTRVILKKAGAYCLSLENRVLRMDLAGVSPGTLLAPITNLAASADWTHVAASRQGSTLKVYVNGSLVKTVPGVTGAIPATTTPWCLGTMPPQPPTATPAAWTTCASTAGP